MIPGTYDWAGGTEAMLRFGPATRPVVIAAMPLFEEANRTRAFMASVLRSLAARDIGGVLPDLPGQGDSPLATCRLSLSGAARALAACTTAVSAGRRIYGIAIRSGALIDDLAPLAGRWHLAPQEGPAMARELRRLRLAGGQAAGGASWYHEVADAHGLVEIGGNAMHTDLLAALEEKALPEHATPGVRIVRLADDPKPADARLTGAPLWRRAEPDNDLALAHQAASDIADWIASCEG